MQKSSPSFSPLLIGIAIVTSLTITDKIGLSAFSPLLIGIAIVTLSDFRVTYDYALSVPF